MPFCGCCRSKVKDAVGNKTCDSTRYRPLTRQEGYKMIQMTFRHGARTPINFSTGIAEAEYPSSLGRDLPETEFPYQVVSIWDGKLVQDTELEPDLKNKVLLGGCRASILTTVGQTQMLDLGRKIKRGYFGELEITAYSDQFVSIRTTNLERTIKSLKCILAGMFGIMHLSAVGPIKFPVKGLMEEDLFPNKIACPALRYAVDMAMAKLAILPSFKNDRLTLLKELRLHPDTFIDFGCLRDDLVCREVHGIPIPPKLVPHREMIEENATKTLQTVYSGKISCGTGRQSVIRLAVGRLLNSIVLEMEAAAQGIETPKLYLYSAHDTTLAPMLDALGIWDKVWPDFASNIIFELYIGQEDNECYVRVLYNGVPQSAIVKGHKKFLVRFDEFKRTISPYMMSPEEFMSFCGVLNTAFL